MKNLEPGGDGGMWLKSSYCSSGACVQARRPEPGVVLVRDSKLGDDSPVLTFTAGAWTAFVASLRGGEGGDS